MWTTELLTEGERDGDSVCVTGRVFLIPNPQHPCQKNTNNPGRTDHDPLIHTPSVGRSKDNQSQTVIGSNSFLNPISTTSLINLKILNQILNKHSVFMLVHFVGGSSVNIKKYILKICLWWSHKLIFFYVPKHNKCRALWSLNLQCALFTFDWGKLFLPPIKKYFIRIICGKKWDGMRDFNRWESKLWPYNIWLNKLQRCQILPVLFSCSSVWQLWSLVPVSELVCGSGSGRRGGMGLHLLLGGEEPSSFPWISIGVSSPSHFSDTGSVKGGLWCWVWSKDRAPSRGFDGGVCCGSVRDVSMSICLSLCGTKQRTYDKGQQILNFRLSQGSL